MHEEKYDKLGENESRVYNKKKEVVILQTVYRLELVDDFLCGYVITGPRSLVHQLEHVVHHLHVIFVVEQTPIAFGISTTLIICFH